MKKQAHLIIAICFSLLVLFSANAGEKTFGEIRKELLGKEVVIMGVYNTIDHYTRYKGEKVFNISWMVAKKNNQGRFEELKEDNHQTVRAPWKLKGAKGIVVAIEINERKKKLKDAFGDTINEENVINPYLDIVVKLHDNTYLIRTTYYTLFMGEDLDLASNIDILQNEALKNTNLLLGKIIFPVAYSKIYPPDVDLDVLTDRIQRSLIGFLKVPNFTPLKIIKVKYLENYKKYLLKVEFLGNKTGIIFPDPPIDDEFFKDRPFLNRAAYGFETEIPKKLTDREVKAIKENKIFIGMSLAGLYRSWGYPDSENDWGDGNEQWIYNDQFVYINKEKIINWQSMNE